MIDRLSIMFSALALSMEAKCGQLDVTTLQDCLAKVDNTLPSDDLLAHAIRSFAVQAELIENPDQLRGLGEDLFQRIDILKNPVPPGIERVDING